MGVIDDHLDYSWNVGRSCRIKECPNCEGMGNSLACQITRKEDGFLWYCFRCSKSGFIQDAGASPSQVRAMVNRKPDSKMNNKPEVVELPYDFSNVLVSQALVDMYLFSVDDDDMSKFNIGWSNEHQRVIYPCYRYKQVQESGKLARQLIGWAGKKLSNDDNKDRPKWHIVRQLDVKHLNFLALPDKMSAHRGEVVVVEDPISAIRVAQAGYVSIGLLTTYLPDTLIARVRDRLVHVWLDFDALDKAVKYIGKLGSNGIKSHLIKTEKDPKEYTEGEINGKINS